MNTEIVKVQTALTEFEKIETGLAELRNKYANVVFDVTTPSGMANAKAARKAVRDPRTETEKIRKDAKAPILDLGRQLDAKAKYITEELMKIEGPIDVQIQAGQTRKDREIFEENQRIIGIRESIHNLELVPASMAGKSSAEIAKRAQDLTAYDLTEWAAEFIVDAEKARTQALAALQQLQAGALAQEQAAAAEDARITAERAELAKLRAEQEERERTEQTRQAEARAAIEAEQAESRAKIRAEETEARLAREAADRKAAEARAADEAYVRAEREKVAKAQKELADAEEARQREIRRNEAEFADARGMLELFISRYGHRVEFKPVSDWIRKYLQKQAA